MRRPDRRKSDRANNNHKKTNGTKQRDAENAPSYQGNTDHPLIKNLLRILGVSNRPHHKPTGQNYPHDQNAQSSDKLADLKPHSSSNLFSAFSIFFFVLSPPS